MAALAALLLQSHGDFPVAQAVAYWYTEDPEVARSVVPGTPAHHQVSICPRTCATDVSRLPPRVEALAAFERTKGEGEITTEHHVSRAPRGLIARAKTLQRNGGELATLARIQRKGALLVSALRRDYVRQCRSGAFRGVSHSFGYCETRMSEWP